MLARHSRVKWLLMGAGVATVAMGVVAYASIPDATGTIHGCFRPGHSGFVRLVDGSACLPGEQAIAWNQTGPAGPAGPPGPAGTAGTSLNLQWRSAQGVGLARAFCLPGEVLVSGCGAIEAASGLGSDPVMLRQSFPISDETGVNAFGSNAIGWQVASSNFADTAIAFAACAAP